MSEQAKRVEPAKIDGVPGSMLVPSVMDRMFGSAPTPRQAELLRKIEALNFTRRAVLLQGTKPTDIIPARLIEQLYDEQIRENKQRGVTTGALADTTRSTL